MAATASTGSSSIMAAASPAMRFTGARSLAPATSSHPTGSPAASLVAPAATPKPVRLRSSTKAVRVGFRPTSRMRIREPAMSPPATSQKLAALRSPGMASARGRSRAARSTRTPFPFGVTGAPIARSIRSV